MCTRRGTKRTMPVPWGSPKCRGGCEGTKVETEKIEKDPRSNLDCHRQPLSHSCACATGIRVPPTAASGHGARRRMHMWYLYGHWIKTKLPHANRFTSVTCVI